MRYNSKTMDAKIYVPLLLTAISSVGLTNVAMAQNQSNVTMGSVVNTINSKISSRIYVKMELATEFDGSNASNCGAYDHVAVSIGREGGKVSPLTKGKLGEEILVNLPASGIFSVMTNAEDSQGVVTANNQCTYRFYLQDSKQASLWGRNYLGETIRWQPLSSLVTQYFQVK